MNLRVVAYGLMALLILVGALLLSSNFGNRPGVPAAVAPVPASAQATSGVQVAPAEPSVAQAVRVLDQTASERGVAKPMPASLRPPEDLRSSDVAEVAVNGTEQVLVFRDGSRLPVTPGLRERLPADLQLKLGYTRDD